MDITHQKNIEKAEKESETAKATAKAKGDFLANMSHEIRTPMNAIIGMTELALETERNTKQHEYLKNIKIASSALLHLIVTAPQGNTSVMPQPLYLIPVGHPQ